MTDTPPDSIEARVVQFSPTLGDVAANEGRIADALRAAADDAVDLLAVPELALTGYHVGTDDPERLATDAAAALDRLATVAPEVTAVVGTPVRDDGRLYNSAVVLDGGEVAGRYDKTHLYDAEGTVFAEGDEYPVIETSAGRLGVEICYDVEFPEVARQLALGGAEVVVTISANMRPFGLDQQTYHRARALENVCPHVLCNRVGTERDVDFFGASGIVDERGRRVVTAGEDREMTVTGAVSLAASGSESLQYLADRRPETYTRE